MFLNFSHFPQIAIHSPYELPTSNMVFRKIKENDVVEATYNMLETISSENIRDLSFHQRKCLFYDESSRNLPVCFI